MAVHETRLLRRELIAADTLAIHFSKPDGYVYRAGQSARFATLDDTVADARSRAHVFSLATAPADAELMIATRTRDTAFKRMLGATPIGTPFRLGAASGELILHRDATHPAVFLAGGIGITPFLSLLRNAVAEAMQREIFLFYSNHSEARIAFLHELREIGAKLPRFHLVTTVTGTTDPATARSHAHGRISRGLLERHLPDVAAATYYLAGPPAMTAAMVDLLDDCGVPDAAIKSAEFYGY